MQPAHIFAVFSILSATAPAPPAPTLSAPTLSAPTPSLLPPPAPNLSAPAPTHDPQQPCRDPATPLIVLARDYDRWPQRPAGKRADDAWQKLSRFLASGSDGDHDRALLAYQNLHRDHPSNAHVEIALAILHTAGTELNFKGSDGYRYVAVQAYSNADSRAARYLASSIERDSTQWIAAVAATRIALVSVDKERIPQAYALLEKAIRADPGNTALRLAWQDLLVRQGRYADALKYSSAHVSPCLQQQVAHAEALMLAGDTAAGSRLYIASLRRAQPHEVDRLYDDVRVMLTVGQNRQYRELTASARPAWLLAYWNRTAAASGRTLETRVVEQAVRAAYANEHFRAQFFEGEPSGYRLAVINDTSHVVPWDARGVYYVRHGPPDHRYGSDDLVEPAPDIHVPTLFEGWVWKQMQPPVIVLISRTVSPPRDWAPLLFPPCTGVSFIGRQDAQKTEDRIRTGARMTMRDMYLAFAAVDQRYAEVARECAFVALGMKRIRYDQLVVQYRNDNHRLLQKLSLSESSLPHFSKPVRIAAGSYQFRAQDGGTEVIALSSIPVVDLVDGASIGSRLRLSYTVTDSMIGSFRTDTTVMLSPNTRTGLVRVPVVWRNPGITSGTLRVTAVDPADTLRGATRAVAFNVLPDAGGVGLSDIVIADTGVPGPLVRGAYRISPVPDHRVRVGDEFRAFFEVYGVPDGDAVETTLHFRRTDPKTIAEQLRLRGRDSRTISFTEAAVLDERGVAVRDIEVAGDLQPGTYSIDVTVRTSAGIMVKREGRLVVEK